MANNTPFMPREPKTQDTPHRAGFVALCGRPNVGKSTLLNALVGEELAVATRHPQTTRERFLGVWTRPTFQAVLVDTPGIHRARSALNKFMVAQAVRGAKDVDLVLMLAEVPAVRDEDQAAAWNPGPVAVEALETLKATGHPLVLVVTKADRVRRQSLLLPILGRWAQQYEFRAIVPVSAIEGGGLDTLESEIMRWLPEGPPLYDPDHLSDRTMRWHASELVRAELFVHLGQELPYSCAVVVDRFREAGEKDRIHATIHVERESQKGMVIGKSGHVIRAVSTGARQRIERLSRRGCDLFLEVRVTKNWTKDPGALERLGYRGEDPAR